MIEAYVLVQTEPGHAPKVASSIIGLAGVSRADDVTGPYDVIVRVSAESVDDLGREVVAGIQQVEGVVRTITCPVVNI